MRVLHFYKTYYPESMGGTEQVINQIACATKGAGVETDVLSLTRSKIKSLEINGHRVHQAHLTFEIASTGFSFSAIRRFKQLAEQVDIIHYHFPWPFMDLVHFATHVKKPTVVTYHSDIIRQKKLLKLYEPLQNRFLSSVDTVIATSPNYLESSAVLQRYREKTKVIPIGINKATYPVPSVTKIAQCHQRFGERFFLFVGMLRYYKGLSVLLDAIETTGFPLVIVGKGPMEEALKKQALKLNLPNIHFVGALPEDDKMALLHACYAMVFPSNQRSEAFGISLLEAAMCSKPLISCEIGTGTTYINRHDETGLVVMPDDPIALRQAMRLLWENPLMAQNMGIQAEKRYTTLFSADKMAEGYLRIYGELMPK